MSKGSKKAALIPMAFENLVNLFVEDFHQIGAMLILGDVELASRHLESFKDDPTGFEAFVNHVHLEDILCGLLNHQPNNRSTLMKIGRVLIKVWSQRLEALLNGREVLFYLGGTDTVSLRFHIDRKDGNQWIDLSDKNFIAQEGIEIYRIVNDTVNPVL